MHALPSAAEASCAKVTTFSPRLAGRQATYRHRPLTCGVTAGQGLIMSAVKKSWFSRLSPAQCLPTAWGRRHRRGRQGRRLALRGRALVATRSARAGAVLAAAPWPQQPGRYPPVPGTAGTSRPGRRGHVSRDHGRDGSVARERLGGVAFQPRGGVTPTPTRRRGLTGDRNAAGLPEGFSRSLSVKMTMPPAASITAISQAGKRGQKRTGPRGAQRNADRLTRTSLRRRAYATACGCPPTRRYMWSNGPGQPRSRAHVLWVYLQNPVFAPIG